jgi:hypothetical protein
MTYPSHIIKFLSLLFLFSIYIFFIHIYSTKYKISQVDIFKSIYTHIYIYITPKKTTQYITLKSYPAWEARRNRSEEAKDSGATQSANKTITTTTAK